MKKITLLAICASSLMYSQIGINTSTPASTLDITANNATGSTTQVDGLLIPRVDRQRIQSMSEIPTSTLVYVNNISTGTQTGITANVDAVGFYFFDGTMWQKFTANSTTSGNNIYNSDGTLTGKRNVNLGGNSLGFTNPGGIGIGTATPDKSAILDTSSSNKGFLPPRVALKSETDDTTIPSPATGLIVCNTNTSFGQLGVYVNLGTPTDPKWSLVQVQNSTIGFSSFKSSYVGEPDPTRVITAGNLQFRLNMVGGNVTFEMRLLEAPTQNMTYYSNRLSWYNTGANSAQTSLTFTPTNWSQWQAYNTSGNSGTYTVAFQVYVNSYDDETLL